MVLAELGIKLERNSETSNKKSDYQSGGPYTVENKTDFAVLTAGRQRL